MSPKVLPSATPATPTPPAIQGHAFLATGAATGRVSDAPASYASGGTVTLVLMASPTSIVVDHGRRAGAVASTVCLPGSTGSGVPSAALSSAVPSSFNTKPGASPANE